jgi:predicted flap endonuclease-1-like 5' DNA nuclease
LANKTLELSRANARISTLEDQIAFRDARIMTLEEHLEAAQLKIEELERKRDALPVVAGPASVSTGAHAPTASLLAAPAARSASKPAIAIPKPADVAKGADSKPALARAANGKRETEQERALDSLAPQAPELALESTASASIPPDADEELANGDAAAPSGPEDVGRIADIGTRFEAALRKQGITRISQIAAWSDADVRQVAKALKIPKSRIVKGRWIEAAREMIGSRSTSE